MDVRLEDGRAYRPEIEKLQPSVAAFSIDFTYKPEVVFSEALETFVPGHEISTTFDDPADEENYYWRFKTYVKLVFCRECYNYTIFRSQECF